MISIDEPRGIVAASLLCACLAIGMAVPQEPGKLFELSGHLPQAQSIPFQVMLDYDPNNSLEGTSVFTGETDTDGAFRANFEVAQGQAFVLLIDRTPYRLWSEPGANLRIGIATSAPPTVTGSVGEENRFLFDQGLVQSGKEKTTDPFDAAQHLTLVAARSESQLRTLAAYLASANASARFGLYVHAQVIGSATYEKNMHPRMLLRRGKIAKDDIPGNYYTFLDSVPILSDDAAFLSRSYQSALQAKFQYMAEQTLIAEGLVPANNLGRWTLSELQLQGEQLAKHPRTNELLFANKLKFMIQYLPAADTRRALDEFAGRFPDSNHLNSIKAKFLKSQSINLALIDEVIDFRNAQGDSVELSSLRGKVLYVDFWGLWCKACMVQRADMDQIVSEFAEDDGIVFLAINFFDSAEAWLEFASTHEGRELHWKPVSAAQEKKAKELLLLESFPRYMLFGRDGELLSASAPVPGSTSIRQLLMDALRVPDNKR